MGTNAFVVPIFDNISKKHDIVAVFTRAPKPMGRKQVLTKSPVHEWAISHGLDVYTSIKDFNNNMKSDLIIVISYGVILRDNVLGATKCVNIHPSDLPKYRGPSPIRTALYNGDKKSAVCLMQMNSDMDAGDIIIRREFDITDDDTNNTVENRVSQVAIDILNEYLQKPDSYIASPQIGTPTYTKKFSGLDEIIDWSRGATSIHNQIRALGAGRTKINGIDVKILETKIENNELNILKIQPSGKKPMDWKSFVNGLHGATITIGK